MLRVKTQVSLRWVSVDERRDGSLQSAGGRTASMMELLLLPRNKKHVLCVSGVLLPHIP